MPQRARTASHSHTQHSVPRRDPHPRNRARRCRLPAETSALYSPPAIRETDWRCACTDHRGQGGRGGGGGSHQRQPKLCEREVAHSARRMAASTTASRPMTTRRWTPKPAAPDIPAACAASGPVSSVLAWMQCRGTARHCWGPRGRICSEKLLPPGTCEGTLCPSTPQPT